MPAPRSGGRRLEWRYRESAARSCPSASRICFGEMWRCKSVSWGLLPFSHVAPRRPVFSAVLGFGFGSKHRDGFDFDEQLRPAENRLYPRRGGQGIEALFPVKGRPLLIEGGIVAFDIAQV